MTHPLTDKLLTQFGIPDDQCVEGERVFFEEDMRAAADWQLEQVMEWLKEHLDESYVWAEVMAPGIDAESVIVDLKQAMRPTTFMPR